MSKRLVVCCDGTWNDPDDHTNISWLNDNIVSDQEQLVFYDQGVGTNWYDRVGGGVLGRGLSQNVRQAYRFIQKHYRPGDEIYCFGFSRGAFTARSLCGFMQAVGRLGSNEEIDEAYFFYRINEPDEDPHIFERLFAPDSQGPIAVKFLGVFDTVGSLGVPLEISDDLSMVESGSLFERARRSFSGWFDRIGDRLRRPIKGFHDTRLGSISEHAYHAIAIDETRAMFVPTLWTAAPGRAKSVTADGTRVEVEQTVEQVWFAGVHSDVGGGYQDEPRLADIPLLWMVEKASAVGLRFKESAVAHLRERTNALAPQHDSMNRFWRKIHERSKKQPVIRPMTNNERKAKNPAGDLYPEVHTQEAVHASVHERLGSNIEILSEERSNPPSPYAPPNLP
jgi:uncharacterized protein (DUF2235 family)